MYPLKFFIVSPLSIQVFPSTSIDRNTNQLKSFHLSILSIHVFYLNIHRQEY